MNFDLGKWFFLAIHWLFNAIYWLLSEGVSQKCPEEPTWATRWFVKEQ
jgi:hypothetical protein